MLKMLVTIQDNQNVSTLISMTVHFTE